MCNMCHGFIIESIVPVRFNPATYSVTEGVNRSAVITLEALANFTNPLTVIVVSRAGSALGGCECFYSQSYNIVACKITYMILFCCSPEYWVAEVPHIPVLPALTFYHPPGGSDYESFRIAVNFTAGVSVVSLPVKIIEDDVAECPEEFFLDLEIPPAAVAMDVMKGSPDSATIIITDEDSEYYSNALLHTYNINIAPPIVGINRKWRVLLQILHFTRWINNTMAVYRQSKWRIWLRLRCWDHCVLFTASVCLWFYLSQYLGNSCSWTNADS